MSLSIDHIVVCVNDLEKAGEEVRGRFGFGSIPGGRHAGHGTTNRIVPLGSSYLELVAVVDNQEAAHSAFGTWVADHVSGELEPHALCMRTDNLDPLCKRFGLSPVAMSRTKPDGRQLRWRLAGLDEMISRGMPFYIEWDIDPSDHPAKAGAAVDAVVEVTLRGHPQLLAGRTSGAEGILVEPGDPGIVSVSVRLGDVVYRL